MALRRGKGQEDRTKAREPQLSSYISTVCQVWHQVSRSEHQQLTSLTSLLSLTLQLISKSRHAHRRLWNGNQWSSGVLWVLLRTWGRCFISNLPHCCDNILRKSNLRKGLCWLAVWECNPARCASQSSRHLLYYSRSCKQRVMTTWTQFHFTFHSVSDSRTRNSAAHIWGGSSHLSEPSGDISPGHAQTLGSFRLTGSINRHRTELYLGDRLRFSKCILASPSARPCLCLCFLGWPFPFSCLWNLFFPEYHFLWKVLLLIWGRMSILFIFKSAILFLICHDPYVTRSICHFPARQAQMYSHVTGWEFGGVEVYFFSMCMQICFCLY